MGYIVTLLGFYEDIFNIQYSTMIDMSKKKDTKPCH